MDKKWSDSGQKMDKNGTKLPQKIDKIQGQ